jgi:hypothetical protein
MQVLGTLPKTDYRILVARKENRPQAQFYGFNLRQPIPPFVVPLQTGNMEPLLGLQRLLHEIYDQAGFDLTLDYRQDPVPPLGEGDPCGNGEAARGWLDTLLRSEGMRQSS